MLIVKTLEGLGECIEFSYHLVRDEFNGREGPTVWSCTIVCDGRSFTAEYTNGCANRVYTTSLLVGGKLRATNKRITIPFGAISMYELENLKASVPIDPDLTDFMYCLVIDAGCAASGDFEDHCEEFGLDSDSISAKKTYDACCDTYMALNRMGFDLDQLSELFRDC